MLSIQALREQRAAKAKALHELVNKETAWNAEIDTPIYNAGLAELDALDGQIGRINEANRRIADDALTNNVIVAADRIARDQRSPGVAAYAKWLRGGLQALSPEELQIVNTMSVGAPAQGGYTVASEVAKEVLDALKAFGGMRKVATVFSTPGGGPMSYPTSDGTAEEGEIVAENVAATAADPTFGTIGLPVYKFSSKIIAVPFELLMDSSTDVEAFVRGRMVKRLGRVTNRKFTVGTGTNEPNGLMAAASVGRVGATGNTASVTYNDLLELQHSVDPAYREESECGFMMHDQSVKVIRKITDGNGRPIFAPGYEQGNPGGAPDQILGDPITINQHCATMAANAVSIAYGALGEYTIRDVMDVQMFRFSDSAYTIKGQVGFLAWLRSGGNLVDVGGGVKTYQNSAT